MWTWHLTPSVLLFFLSGSISLVVSILNWRLRQQPGFAKLALIMFLVSLWTLASGLELTVQQPDAKWLFVLIESTLVWLFNTLIVPLICEIFQYKWLTRPRLFILFLIPAIFQLLEWTNSFHHLIWNGYSLSPDNPDILMVHYGPLYNFEAVYLILFTCSCVLLLLFEMQRLKGWKRVTAGLIAVSISVPYLTYFGYVLLPGEILGISLMPIGYSISGISISWVVFEDLQRTVRLQTSQLVESIQELQMEISNRKLLEQDLLSFQESLAQQLSDQTRKLASLYEMILLSGKSLPLQTVLEQSLARIRSTLGCELVCYYDLVQGLPVTAFSGTGSIDNTTLAKMHFEWMGQSTDLIARVHGRTPDDLPEEVRQAGFMACAGKRVRINRDMGIFACFWQDLHQFRVDEISLITAFSEELGVILENALMRELTTVDATQLERRRLARDLHDSVVQSLHSLVFTANTARHAAISKPENLERILVLLSSSAQLALKEMRLLLFELQLAPAGQILFLEGIQIRLDAVERRANIDVELSVETGTSWPQSWEKDLYAISMEALNNSLKHAQATRVEVCIASNDHKFELKIMDNGLGFDMGTVRRGGMGLSTMAERAERLGGRLEIKSAPGAGTLVTVVIAQPDGTRPEGIETT